jgi:hypothetical protein
MLPTWPTWKSRIPRLNALASRLDVDAICPAVAIRSARCRMTRPAPVEVRVSLSYSGVNLCDTKNVVPLATPCCRLRPGIMRSGDSRQVRPTLPG